MISRKMQDALNSQIREEMYSSNLYLSMAAWSEACNLKGFSHWMRIQSKEELGHALKLFDYLIERGGKAQIQAIGEPQQEFKSPREVFEQTLAHELKISKKIHELYELALEEKDYATQNLMMWYISEQVEEEAHVTEYVEKLKMIGESSNAIFWIDKELRKREG
jgi:ferritin